MVWSNGRPKRALTQGPLARQTTHQAMMSRLHGRRQPTRCRQSRVAHMPLRSESPTSRNRQALPPCCAVVSKRPVQISTTAPKRPSPSRGVVRGACPFGLRRLSPPNAQACRRQGMRRPGPLNHPGMLARAWALCRTCHLLHRPPSPPRLSFKPTLRGRVQAFDTPGRFNSPRLAMKFDMPRHRLGRSPAAMALFRRPTQGAQHLHRHVARPF